MELTVASWNVDGWHTIRDEQLDLLDDTGAHVALLQEVTPASLERLREAGWSGTSALELVDEGHTERGGAAPRFACAVVVRGDLTIDTVGLVPHTPSPVRAVIAHLRMGDHHAQAISAALPPGSMWGRTAKVGQADAISRALEGTGLPRIIGMDRNGPRFERWDPATTEWWREDPRGFFDLDAPHGCVDVLDRWYAEHPDISMEARRQRPEGPRAVSYVETRADPPIERRYDVIMASDHFAVADVRYRFDEAEEAGSDHGLVESTLVLTDDIDASPHGRPRESSPTRT